jgi:glutamate-ammonia-ligase adenylyltransferase
VNDVLYVTDSNSAKITSPERQRQLRAATVLVKHFTHLLPRSPNPESALSNFRQFLRQLFARPDWPDELSSLERPKVLDALARLLGVSDFLWEDFLRMQHDNLFRLVSDVDGLAAAKTKEQLREELETALRAERDPEARRRALNTFKDREMFRVDMRSIQGYSREFGRFSAELSDLAEVVVQAAHAMIDEEMRARYGEPRLEDGSPCPLSVCALGKLGGRELGYASDIELMFIYAGNGTTAGTAQIATAEYFERLVQEFINTIRTKREGIFEVDLQLRPYGSAGRLAVAVKAFRQYYAPGGPAWHYERQALVRLRPVAGDPEFGQSLVALRDEFVFTGQPYDVAAMRAMRERQIRHFVAGGSLNVKFSPGGLVDVEYLVQGLQIAHGHADPAMRSANTRAALAALRAAGVVNEADYQALLDAYNFLRQVINALRVVRGHAKDMKVPAAGDEEFAFLARRLHYEDDHTRLSRDLEWHTAAVREINARYLTN